jgi:hypothetical protein
MASDLIEGEAVQVPATELATPPRSTGFRRLIDSMEFVRHESPLPGGGVALVDRFPRIPGVRCTFARYPAAAEREVVLRVDGRLRLQACAHGGWLLHPRDDSSPAYWIPTLPVLRKHDSQGHVLAERPAPLDGMREEEGHWEFRTQVPQGWCLDAVGWRFEQVALSMVHGLAKPSTLERQPIFLWGSKVNCHLPAGLYRYLLHGELYTDDFVWPRKWKFPSEIDAHGIYVGLDGLESATGNALYGLLKRQVLYSVLLRQAEDGGWYHGEWTDLMESHYRLHNSAMSVLETGLAEFGDAAIGAALEKAADFLAGCTDETDLGPWFLHDSLERSVESMEVMRQQTNTPWIPSRTLGKSPTTKLILNTHIDALVVLDRYAALTGDLRHAELVRKGCDAAMRMLELRPAEWLYRLLYRAIGLTLLPSIEGAKLAAPLRAVKRLTWMYLTPNMHRVKRIFPRLVMPGGLIERHIAPLHYDINYHPVNVLDLARLRQRFPAIDLKRVVEDAVAAVDKSRLLAYWAESPPRRFAVAVWVDVLYRLCLLDGTAALRSQLARTMLAALDAGLGMPPSVLGSDVEAVDRSSRRPCPVIDDPRLTIANLGHDQIEELVVVNPTPQPIAVKWRDHAPGTLQWADGTGYVDFKVEPPRVPPRGWLHGRGPCTTCA